MSHSIVAIGELLWDVFPDERRPGGAPCNVAYHAARLGNRASVITRVGSDADGDELVGFLAKRGLNTSLIQRDSAHPTGIVRVKFVEGEPEYTIVENVAWDNLQATPVALEAVSSADALCFGSLAQRSAAGRTEIQKLVAAAGPKCLKVFDVNLRPPFVDRALIEASLLLANVVKLNASEAETLSKLFGRTDLTSWLLSEMAVSLVCSTFGAEGAAVVTLSGSARVPASPVDTEGGDFVGVGDAFIAAMTHRLVRGDDPTAAVTFANRYAALIATRRGAMPDIDEADYARFVN